MAGPTVTGWWRKRWVQSLLAVAAFAVLGLILMLVTDRKDADYWSGYSNAQHWVDDGGYAAREESIADYCTAQAAGQQGARNYGRGCRDGAHNAMRPAS